MAHKPLASLAFYDAANRNALLVPLLPEPLVGGQDYVAAIAR